METQVRERVVWVDYLRGVACLLMLLDHVLLLLAPESVVRLTVTRFSLPLFMLCAAAVWRPGARPRLLWLGLALPVEAFLLAVIGMPQPGILFLFFWLQVALLGWPGLALRPYLWIVVGLVQTLYLPVGWYTYEPGLVAAWFFLGRLVIADPTFAADRAARPAGAAWVRWLGARPLEFYVAHLFLLAPFSVLVRSW